MNFNYCPNCGGALESVSNGWICHGECRGFVDLEGIVHKHREEPFMAPKTNADRIREMSDEELADFIPNWSYTNACRAGEKYVDCNNECEKCVAAWLMQPVEEE